MDILRTAEIKALAKDHEPPCISLYLPMQRPGMDAGGSSIRFKNVLKQAEAQLVERGTKPGDIENLLAPAWHLHEDKLFWKHQSEGFACFIARGVFRYYRAPWPFRELAVVNRRFHLKPLLELLSMDGHFYVLALSEHHNRLLYCTRYGHSEVLVSDMPPNMAYTLRFDEHEATTQFHVAGSVPGGRPNEITHGHGGQKDLQHTSRARYFREVDSALHKALRDEQAPLIVAAVVEEKGLFREVSDYAHVTEEFIPGNPETTSAAELQDRGWQIVQAIFDRCRRDALQRLEEGLAHDKGLADFEDVVRAAHDGLIDQLFVSVAEEVWGTYDADLRLAHIHTQREPDDDDLLNLTALQVLAQGGVVWALERDAMPMPIPTAALLRYAVPAQVVHS